jgi:hypothetical protein
MTSAAKMALSFVAGAAVATLVAVQLRRPDGFRIEPTTSAPEPPARTGPAPHAPLDTSTVRSPRAPDASASKPDSQRNPDREQLQRSQIATLQARVRQLEQRAAAAEPKRKSDDEAPQRMKFHDFTDAELQAMAQNCEVRFDLPRTTREPYQLPPGLGARMHLSEAEQQRVSAEVDNVSREVVAHLRAFYLEATGDAAGADALEPQSLMQEILEKSPPAAVRAAHTEIARERAGLPPSPSGSIAERYLRYMTSVGDSLQHALEPALGAQHAATVRDALAQSSSVMSGCAH